jgi:ribose transport system ATP-binding protein
MSVTGLPHSARSSGAPLPGAEVLRLRGLRISKTYKSQRALSDVELALQPGELHGLVGQNGSGKSTLMKILSGYHAPDAGAHLELDGRPVPLPVRVSDLRRHGIAVVHQSLGLIGEFSTLDNIRAGRWRGTRWSRRIRRRHEEEQALEVLERLGQSVDLDRPVAQLSAQARATVAIARALQDYEPGRGVILLDEATRALTRPSLAHFYELLRAVVAEGASVLLVSHRLEEVLGACDRVTVLRDGAVVAPGVPATDLDESALTRLMLGYEQRAHARPSGEARDDCVAEVEGLRGETVKDFAVRIGRGEIVGITGLAGSGFEEVPYLLAGAARAAGGVLTAGGQPVDLGPTGGASVESLIAAGIFLIPEKRDEEGLAVEMSILDNITLPRVGEKGRRWLTGRSWQLDEVQGMIARLGITPPRPDALVSTLSGGNQQKVLLGKWLAGRPRLLLLHEPTQGVDVGARGDIINVLRAEAERGCGVLISATDVGDLTLICDRVLILRDGRVVEELTGDFDQDEIVEATFRTGHAAPRPGDRPAAERPAGD